MKYPLSSDTWGEEELNAIQEVIDSNRFTMGPKVEQFEKEFAVKYKCRNAIMVNSGSSANLLMIGAMIHTGKLKPGDEIIVPAVSWSTTYFPIHQYGLKLLFVDVDKDTLNIDLKQLEEAAKRPTTKAVFAVNLLGNSCDQTEMRRIVRENDLHYLEDTCESLGSISFTNKKGVDFFAGQFGIMSSFSFFFSHHISTMEGGMIMCYDEELAQVCRSLRAHGWMRELPDKNFVADKIGDPFQDAFRFGSVGYSVRPLEMSGAIGTEQLKKLDGFIEGRRKNAEVFKELFDNQPWCRIQKEVGKSSWFGFAIVLKGQYKGKRDKVIEILTENNVETRPIVAGNFVRNPVIDKLNYGIWTKVQEPTDDTYYVAFTKPDHCLPVANDIHDNGFFIGNSHLPLIENFKGKDYCMLSAVHTILSMYVGNI